MIVTRDQQVLGDRVVYTSTNDVMVVTGEMVILASPQGVGLGHRVVFDRGAGVFRGEGPFAFDGFAPGGTNRAALLPGRGTGTNATNTVPAKIPSPPLRPAPGRK